MTFPESYGPGEEATPEEIEEWLRKMVQRRLFAKRYEIIDGEGQWTYHNTPLGSLVISFHSLLARLHVIGEGDILPIIPGFRKETRR